MNEFTKSERRELRELAGRVYEAEAHRMLEELDAEFECWRSGEMPSSELLSSIHEFHQHQSRDLWSVYQSLRDPNIVARGIALGLIAADAATEQLRIKLASMIAFYTELIPGKGE